MRMSDMPFVSDRGHALFGRDLMNDRMNEWWMNW